MQFLQVRSYPNKDEQKKIAKDVIVSKFGGTSLASTDNIRKVCEIINQDDRRQIIVVSAPGKRSCCDMKITDCLSGVATRFSAIEQELGIDGFARDYLLSRGEYLMAKLLARHLGFAFVDLEASGVIAFDEYGQLDLESSRKNFERFRGKRIVIPGFYGVLPNGNVKTFERGGSDITGAIIANLTDALLYENWTDVDGFYESDPNKFDSSFGHASGHPKCFASMSYKHAEMLARSGANVLHPDCIEFVRQKDIPIVIRNTFNTGASGTYIKALSKK